MPDAGLIVVFLGVATAFGCLWFAVRGPATQRERALKRRTEAVSRRFGPSSASEAATVKKAVETPSASLAPILRWLPRQAALRERLARTGRAITVRAYVLTSLVLAVVAFALVVVPFGLPWPLGLAAGTIVGCCVPHLAVGWLGARRVRAFIGEFPEAIDLIVRGLRSGLPVSESIAAVGREMADPIGIEFRAVSDAVRLGRTLEEALWDTAQRLDTPEFKFFVVSLAIQRETGGNLAETLANLADILRRRRQMRLKVRALSSEARASAMILAALPFVMFGIIYSMNPGYASMLFSDPRGKMMLGAALVVMFAGVLVMRRMVRFEP